MNNKKSWHSHLLTLSAIGIGLTTASSFISSQVGSRPAANFEFPQSFDAGNVSAHQSSSLDRQPEFKANQEYQFILDNKKFNLVIDYAVGTRGNLVSYLQDFTHIDQPSIDARQIKYHPDIGHYALLKDDQSFYLCSCLSPRSLTSVTQKQFSRQRYRNDLKLAITWQWLQNQASIRDRRCLWMTLSVPINNYIVANEYQLLEKAWGDLYRWWLPNFPPLTIRTN